MGGPADLRQLGKRLDWLRSAWPNWKPIANGHCVTSRPTENAAHGAEGGGAASLLREEVPGPLDAGQREVVEHILQHNVRVLQEQIESLLTLNAAAFMPPSATGTSQAEKLLAGVVQRRDLHSQARQLQVITEAPDQLVTLDAEKMTVVLDNLLSNAIDFSPDNGEIRLLVSHSEGLWRLSASTRGRVWPRKTGNAFSIPSSRGSVCPGTRPGQRGWPVHRARLVRAMGGRVYLVPQERGAHFMSEYQMSSKFLVLRRGLASLLLAVALTACTTVPTASKAVRANENTPDAALGYCRPWPA